MKKLLLVSFVLTSTEIFGQLPLGNLKVDTTITSFKLASDHDEMYIYLPNGKDDFVHNRNTSSFSILVKPFMDFQSAVRYLDYQINYSKSHGSKLIDIVRNETTIDGNRAYEVTFTQTGDGKSGKNLIFYSFILKGSKAIIFLSDDIDNGKYREKFIKTFRALKM